MTNASPLVKPTAIRGLLPGMQSDAAAGKKQATVHFIHHDQHTDSFRTFHIHAYQLHIFTSWAQNFLTVSTCHSTELKPNFTNQQMMSNEQSLKMAF